jgi:RimJ/RimL family protein N-acetyltransferase
MRPIPYRIETERLVIRCWHPRDAPLLKAALDSSLDHLRPWMPWAEHEPSAEAVIAERLRRFRGLYDLDQDNVLGLFTPDESAVVGGSGFHPRQGLNALEIGYWIAAAHEGRGLVTETVAALTRVAFDLVGVDRVTIVCDPANARSAAVPRRLGYVEEGLLRHRIDRGEGRSGDALSFSMFADTLAASPCGVARYRAFDATGAVVG